MLLSLPCLAARKRALRLESDAQVKSMLHEHDRLMMLLHSPFDPDSQLAIPPFDAAARAWGAAGNVTLATVRADLAPGARKMLGAKPETHLPVYGLKIRGIALISYRGGWSEKSVSAFLRAQTAVRPVAARSAAHVDELVRNSAHGLVAIGLLPEADQRSQLLEQAAHAEGVLDTPLAHGGRALADELGAPYPCLLIARADGRAWPLLRAPTVDGARAFLRDRALPLVVPQRTDGPFRDQLLHHAYPVALQVLLFHRASPHSIDADARDASAAALEEAAAAAPALEGVATFVEYDFYDNDPSMVQTFGVFEGDLPALVVVLRRGTMDEKRWRLKGRVERRAIAALVAQAQKEGGAPTTPPPRWASLRPGEAETQRAGVDARGGARTLEELSEDI